MFKCVSLVGSPVRAMSKIHFRAFLVLLVFILLAAPSLSNPGGPPGLQNGELTTEVGCSCHGGGLPSTEVLVQISVYLYYVLLSNKFMIFKLLLIHIQL